MINRILHSLLISFFVSVGFILPDYFKGVIDRADVAVPMIAFGTAFLTLTFWGKDK